MDSRGAETLFQFAVKALEMEPKAILEIEYDRMLKIIYLLFAKDKKELCTICVILAYQKYGPKLMKDLESMAAEMTLQMIAHLDDVKSN